MFVLFKQNNTKISQFYEFSILIFITIISIIILISIIYMFCSDSGINLCKNTVIILLLGIKILKIILNSQKIMTINNEFAFLGLENSSN